MGRGSVLIRRLLPGTKVAIDAHTWHGGHAAHGGVIVVQTEVRGETGATLERMVGEEGVYPNAVSGFVHAGLSDPEGPVLMALRLWSPGR
jgi:hypothetical protein